MTEFDDNGEGVEALAGFDDDYGQDEEDFDVGGDYGANHEDEEGEGVFGNDEGAVM